MASDDPTQAAKADLRTAAQKTRSTAARAANADAAALAVRDTVLAALDAGGLVPPQRVVSGYLPLGDEIDPRPTMLALAARGWTMALPVVVAKATPLEFRAWTPDAPLDDGPFRTRHPAGGAAVVDPGLILSPMLAFDAEGYRLGWGGGFYDRTIARRRPDYGALFVGCAFAAQQVDAVPRGKYDMALDAVATERGLMRISRG